MIAKGENCVKRKNHLASNLKAFQRARHITQAEFARELDVPKSTLQTVMDSGNTTLETLINISESLNVSLDELVFGAEMSNRERLVEALLRSISWFTEQPADRQKELCYHINSILNILTREEVLEILDTVNDVRLKYDGDL